MMILWILFLVILHSRSTRTHLQKDNDEVIQGPKYKNETSSWLESITKWREDELKRINYNSYVYDNFLFWTETSFIQPQMMIQDRFFFDLETYQYTIDKYLKDLTDRYGGIDSVLIWPGYPNIGVDNRNQYDLWRDMPGGVTGITKFIEQFHQNGVQVLFPWYPWDIGTRYEGEGSDVLPKLLKEINGDGFNCDTCQNAPHIFWNNSIKDGHPIAMEPEGGGVAETLDVDKLGWGYWSPYDFIPSVDRWKWMEQRHMTNICDRWMKDRTDQLQSAFFNMCGYESWENVWGIWMGITDRNSEALRRVSSILRYFKDFAVSTKWEPHTLTIQNGIFASKFPGTKSGIENQKIWTFVNRNDEDVDGDQVKIEPTEGMKYYDVYHGTELFPTGTDTLCFSMDKNGFGSVLEIPSHEVTSDLLTFLASMKSMTSKKLSEFSNEFTILSQQLIEIPKTKKPTSPPKNMIEVPETKSFEFVVNGLEIEGDTTVGVDVQYPWEKSPSKFHSHALPISSFFIDVTPVTNAQYKTFLIESKYKPFDPHNFLRDWIDWENQTYPSGYDDKPVTWVSMDDSREYCRFFGKRMPNEWEWQYAAQGDDKRVYPWGNEFDESKVPKKDLSRSPRVPDSVFSHPGGASFFKVLDMVGNVWQWTNEFVDPHTRGGITKGGSLYYPQGSHWYYPNTYKTNEHGKFLLMADSYDRSGYIGFRCVMDNS